MEQEAISLFVGNWVTYRSPSIPGVARVAFADHDGRLVPIEVALTNHGGLDSGALRQIPLGRIEAWANAPENAGALRQRLDESSEADPISQLFKNLAVEAVAEVDVSAKPPRQPTTYRIAQPGGTADYGDAFYQTVAEKYQSAAANTRGPSTLIAGSSGVPVSTVHRWVKEARRRGFLPPGRPGKAG